MSDDVREEFDRLVNMTRKELEDWLETDESKDAGQKDGGGESIGHASGRQIVRILGTRKSELTDDDVAHMRKVNGYINRHLAQRPDKPKAELEDAAWTHSLRNWGHDPLK
jgi:predicted transglutaminase-like cysteine proteinase